MSYYPLSQEQKQQKTYKQIIFQNNMKIRKYLNAKDLPEFSNTIEYLYECEYCLQNYDEEGNKTDAQIYTDQINRALESDEMLNQEEDSAELFKNGENLLEKLLQFMEENEVDFVRID